MHRRRAYNSVTLKGRNREGEGVIKVQHLYFMLGTREIASTMRRKESDGETQELHPT